MGFLPLLCWEMFALLYYGFPFPNTAYAKLSHGLPRGELLATSTPRAVLWSALTTIASFGSLGFASHRGMASLGQLLTLGIALMLIANLMVLPALIALVGGRAPLPPASKR